MHSCKPLRPRTLTVGCLANCCMQHRAASPLRKSLRVHVQHRRWGEPRSKFSQCAGALQRARTKEYSIMSVKKAEVLVRNKYAAPMYITVRAHDVMVDLNSLQLQYR
mmetsp:Transcript_2651/g.5499  ORF Transcript_2651/g.5499 Transcript_2651/m.5499 type:complete len:107 (-) Transcript_2651:982-1302(-)